jgi:hypothetical protein
MIAASLRCPSSAGRRRAAREREYRRSRILAMAPACRQAALDAPQAIDS